LIPGAGAFEVILNDKLMADIVSVEGKA